MKLFIVVLFSLVGLGLSKPFEQTLRATCGYGSCHAADPNRLNIHLVPHSHDDVGWLKTVDQYYYGHRDNIQKAAVQHIIGSVVEALEYNPDRRFIQVETAFFWQWWQRQTEEIQEVTRNLVDSGRLEIINGAWSMNDEAAAHYHSIIDQFTWGLRKINDTLGECGRPKVGWQIDPFGHSKEMATIFAQIGFESLFFARLDYRDQKKRHDEKNLEMVWQGSQDYGSSSNIFTSVLHDFYTAPSTFCWDVVCRDEPIIDDESSPEYNVKSRVEDFAQYSEGVANYFKTNNILLTMGGDFTYQAAEMYFINMDKLIEGFKRYRPDINIIYSTPSCYTKAVNEEANSNGVSFQMKTDDFFPYASDSSSYWTGYYTSRPNSKRFERQGNNLLQVTKQLISFEKQLDVDYSEDTILLKEAMGIMQHHDAITGTEKQHVADDYVRILKLAMDDAEKNVDEIVLSLLKKNDDVSDVKVDLASCLLTNVSHCETSTTDRFTVAVYNPLSRKVNHYVRLPVNEDSYKITGPDGDVDFVVLPTIMDFSYVENANPTDKELVFVAENLPALGLKYYYVEKISGKSKVATRVEKTRLGTETSGFEIDDDGLLSSVTLNGITLPVKQEFMYYNGANENRASGAYVFRPHESTPSALPLGGKATITIYTSDIVDEVHQAFELDWIKQIIRVYKNENYIEFDWIVGPLEYLNDLAVEVITRFTTNLESDAIFYTDANGRQMVKRVRNYRETYDYTDDQPASGNYYPITSKIVLKDVDKDIELAILNDRAQGGASLKDGALELMVHRRLQRDDGFGVDEVLNEQEFGRGVVARGQHYLTFGSSNSNSDGRSSAAQQRDLAQRKLLSPWAFIGDATTTPLESVQEKLNLQFSGLTRDLPENVQILTLETWNENVLLLRLEHVLESEEDATLSTPVTVDLKDLFTLFDITSIEEMNLAANQPVDSFEKLQWNIENDSSKRRVSAKVVDNEVTLSPMDIRTFLITTEVKATV